MQFTGNTLSLFDAADGLIDSFTVTPAGATSPQFAGFTDANFEFRKVVLDFGGVDAVGIDNVYYTTSDTAPVPLPAGLPLLLAGFGVLAALRRRARQKA